MSDDGDGERGGGGPVVVGADLPRWGGEDDDAPRLAASPEEEPAASPSPFPVNERLNAKVALWSGDIASLSVDAVVNTTNERLNDRTGVAGRIFARAGPDLAGECMQAEGCHTGEACITKGCDLPAPHVIHTVGPRFSVKYQTAAENALHGSYRRCLEVLKENGLESIAFPRVNTDKKGYPKEGAAHIAARTVRRFLERYGSTIHTVVFALESDEDMAIYRATLPLYFPRTPDEERVAAARLPDDVGNELGESVIPDRQIRISTLPGMGAGPVPVAAAPAASASAVVAAAEAAGAVAPPPPAADPFSDMQDNPDDQRRKEDGAKSRAQLEREEAERRYAVYLRRAREEDLSDLDQYGFIYTSGVDELGRDVVVFVASQLPAKAVDLDRILLYLIRFLDPIVQRDYVIVYFHTNIQAENKPPLAWLKEIYSVFDRKYKKNLKRLFIVHPSWWVKVVLFFVSPFISSKFWKKLKKVDKLLDLYEDIDAQTLRVPQAIVAYDQEVHRGDYAAVYDDEQSGGAEGGAGGGAAPAAAGAGAPGVAEGSGVGEDL